MVGTHSMHVHVGDLENLKILVANPEEKGPLVTQLWVR
jgi:hypothetical protein